MMDPLTYGARRNSVVERPLMVLWLIGLNQCDGPIDMERDVAQW